MNNVTNQNWTLGSGQTVSSPVLIGNAALGGVVIPDLTSAFTISLQVAAFNNPSSYYALYKADGSGQWSSGSMTGNRAMVFSPDVHAFEYMRIVCSPAMIGDKVFTIVNRQL